MATNQYNNAQYDDMWQDCLPTYVVIDVSGSMSRYQDLLNRTLKNLHSKLINSPRVSEFAHMSIIAFSSQAWMVIEMTDIEYVSAMPEVICNGTTNYSAAFDMVRTRIDIDLPSLRQQHKRALRPTMFFFTDGAPLDKEWQSSFARLTDRSWSRRPHVITYGFGTASEAVLSKVATKAAFQAEGQLGQEDALTSAINSLLNSLVASASAGEMQIPTQAPGFRSIPLEYVE